MLNDQTNTVGFLIHGRHARIFGQIFDQIFGNVFDQGFWPWFFGHKIQCTGLPGQRNTVYSTTGTEKYSFTVLQGQRKPCIKNPILLKIPYIKNLTVYSITVRIPMVFHGLQSM